MAKVLKRRKRRLNLQSLKKSDWYCKPHGAAFSIDGFAKSVLAHRGWRMESKSEELKGISGMVALGTYL